MFDTEIISFSVFAVLFFFLDFSWKFLSWGMGLYMLFMSATVLRFLYDNIKMFADTINENPFTFTKKN